MLLRTSERVFDYLHHLWERRATFRLISTLLISGFFVGLALVELKRWGILKESLVSEHLQNHFFAIEVAFTLLLLAELLSLIFVMPNSIAISVGKQFEILSLILLRSAFKEFSYIREPITWVDLKDSVAHVASDAFGGLLIFILLGFYYRIHRGVQLTPREEDKLQFVAYKKMIALLLLLCFLSIGVLDLVHFFSAGEFHNSFNTFYTLLIFTDILILLIALRYHPDYYTLFRYSAFVLATVLIRISLVAPPYFNAIIGIGALAFSILLTYSFRYFQEHPHE